MEVVYVAPSVLPILQIAYCTAIPKTFKQCFPKSGCNLVGVVLRSSYFVTGPAILPGSLRLRREFVLRRNDWHFIYGVTMVYLKFLHFLCLNDKFHFKQVYSSSPSSSSPISSSSSSSSSSNSTPISPVISHRSPLAFALTYLTNFSVPLSRSTMLRRFQPA